MSKPSIRLTLLESLKGLLPGRFDEVVFILNVSSHVSAPAAPRATRAVELIQYCESAGRLRELTELVASPGPARRRRR